MSLDPIEHERKLQSAAFSIGLILGLLLGAASIAALWAASVRWPEIF